MIDFRKITLLDKPIYERYKKDADLRGCEMSFGNLYLWGEQKIAFINGYMLFLATFSKSFYPFPGYFILVILCGNKTEIPYFIHIQREPDECFFFIR